MRSILALNVLNMWTFLQFQTACGGVVQQSIADTDPQGSNTADTLTVNCGTANKRPEDEGRLP
jgi:hypothetical protein